MSEVEKTKRLRGAILQLLDQNHRNQQSRLELITLAGVLEKLFIDCSLNELITVLQDLKERGYIGFEQRRNRFTNAVSIGRIEIHPSGRDVVEGTRVDPAVVVVE